jgi:predicted short-subunit dehydrogenase-like oxidoreductase (DUF2520 family)
MASLAIAGPGRMGLSLAAAFARSGAFHEIVVFGRHPEPPAHPLFEDDGPVRYVFGLEPLAADTQAVLLAVPDDAIPEVAFHLAELGDAPEGCAAFHLSGSIPTDVLEPLHHRGYGVGSFHPLVVLTDPERSAGRFAGAYAAVTAAPGPFRTAQALSDLLGLEVFPIPAARRPLYHAAVTLVEAAVVPVVVHAAALLVQAGVEPDDALPAVASLARGSLTSLVEGGVAEARAGVIGRGDPETVALHLRALEPEDQRLYAVFVRALLHMAENAPSAGAPTAEDPADQAARHAVDELLARHAELEPTGAGS